MQCFGFALTCHTCRSSYASLCSPSRSWYPSACHTCRSCHLSLYSPSQSGSCGQSWSWVLRHRVFLMHWPATLAGLIHRCNHPAVAGAEYSVAERLLTSFKRLLGRSFWHSMLACPPLRVSPSICRPLSLASVGCRRPQAHSWFRSVPACGIKGATP